MTPATHVNQQLPRRCLAAKLMLETLMIEDSDIVPPLRSFYPQKLYNYSYSLLTSYNCLTPGKRLKYWYLMVAPDFLVQLCNTFLRQMPIEGIYHILDPKEG